MYRAATYEERYLDSLGLLDLLREASAPKAPKAAPAPKAPKAAPAPKAPKAAPAPKAPKAPKAAPVPKAPKAAPAPKAAAGGKGGGGKKGGGKGGRGRGSKKSTQPVYNITIEPPQPTRYSELVSDPTALHHVRRISKERETGAFRRGLAWGALPVAGTWFASRMLRGGRRRRRDED